MSILDDTIARKMSIGDKTFAIIVTGSRDWPVENEMMVWTALADVLNKLPADWMLVVRHGDYHRGIDRMAKRWTQLPSDDPCADTDHRSSSEVVEDPHPALWSLFGSSAGPIRNQEMVDAGADLMIAFPLASSVGTYGCMQMASTAGISIRTYSSDGSYREEAAL